MKKNITIYLFFITLLLTQNIQSMGDFLKTATTLTAAKLIPIRLNMLLISPIYAIKECFSPSATYKDYTNATKESLSLQDRQRFLNNFFSSCSVKTKINDTIVTYKSLTIIKNILFPIINNIIPAMLFPSHATSIISSNIITTQLYNFF